MDITDILGGLLGGKTPGGSGGGGDIFGDILARAGQASRTGPAPKAGPAPRTGPAAESRRPGSGAAPQENDVDRMARELEDFLGVGRNRGSGPSPQPPQKAPPPQQTQRPQPPSQPAPRQPRVPTSQEVDDPFSRPAPETAPAWPQTPNQPTNDRGQILVRAMVNAAKADGRITPDEQQKILGQLGNASGEAVQFLRDELAQPLDVHQFAWSVPIGMEQEVYALSLLAVTVDSSAESQYLEQLAHGLRLPAEAREQLAQRFGTAGQRGL